MPKSKTPAPLSADDLDVETVLAHLNHRRREYAIGAVVVAVVAGGLMLWRLSIQQKQNRAETALTAATNSLYAGNRPLAATQLQALADRYRDTPAGVEGAMVLAQLDFEDAKWADGIKVLEAIQQSGSIQEFRSPVEGLLGGAYSDMKNFDESAKHYRAAEADAQFQSTKDLYLASVARTLMLAGKSDEARKVWQELVSRPDSPVVAEAKVRLGELEGVPARKN